MASGPMTLTFMRTVTSQREVEESINRKSSGFGYYMLAVPILWFLPWMLIYELFSREHRS